VFPVRYELGFYIPEDGTLHSHRRENRISYKPMNVQTRKNEFLRFIKREKYIDDVTKKAENSTDG
jgi:hypothetical protein